MKNERVNLKALAAKINAGHDKCLSSARSTVEHARHVGELLRQAKAAVGHGKWTDWVAENCQLGIREAQRYMLIAKSAPLLEQQPGGLAKATIKDVLNCLAGTDKQSSATEASTPAADPFAIEASDIERKLGDLPAAPAFAAPEETKIQKWVEARQQALYESIRKFARQVRPTGETGPSELTVAVALLRRLIDGLSPTGLSTNACTVPATPQAEASHESQTVSAHVAV